jgi:hypothetical protein
MSRAKMLVTLAVVVTLVAVLGAGPSSAEPPKPANPGQELTMAVIEVDSLSELGELTAMGLDIAAVRESPPSEGARGLDSPTYRVEAVISIQQGQTLDEDGFSWEEVPGRGPTHKIGSPYDVYHSFDEPILGIKAQLRTLASSYPQLTALRTIGQSVERRPLLAMRLTNEQIRSDKPEVLFIATTHAREWVSTEVAMRLIEYLTSNHGSDARVTELLDTTEVWIIPVVNPDGYQYTFTDERLWRKNLQDNDGDGEITLADGVDLNRNYDSHWGYDNEGSSPNPPDATYRGPEPESEPETRALVEFMKQHDFEFAHSYHTYGNLLLYPWGWQVKTPSLDDAIFVAQAGTDANPAVVDTLTGTGYDPGVGADLYITNGEFTDWAYDSLGIPAYTTELTSGVDGADLYGFEFPDDENMVQTVFEDNLEFALSLAESALDPAHPVSPVGITTEDLYHTPLTGSNGPNQIVEVVARKGLDLSLSYSIDGGGAQTDAFNEEFGSIYNDEPGVFYTRYVARIEGQSAGDTVTYEVTGDATAGPYTYTVTSSSGNPVLVVAAEDYSGPAPNYADPTQPNYLDYYTDALDAGGYSYDVWDVDTQGIPDHAEVLSHYEVVIWYTGDDFAAFVPLGLDTQEAEVLEFREFLNHDGRIFATGQDLAWLATPFGYYSDDFFQYYLGAFIDIDTAGIDPESGLPFSVKGEPGDPVFDELTFGLAGGDGADNQCCSSSFLTTSSFLPHFDNDLAARYDRAGGPFEPHSGDWYVYSRLADQAYKRLGGTFDVPEGTASLTFWVSYDIETDWDFAFVEVSETGSDVWTTLPEVGGLTTTNTGESCLSGWVDEIHPFLAHYMDADCNPAGTTGSWNALTGNSGGWQQVEFDLSAYAGQTVELHISYATDWATQGLGVFVDDIELSGQPLEDFEAGLGSWSASAGPGSVLVNNWERITGADLPEGPAIRTPSTVYLGFGFESIDTEDDRNEVMDRVMQYLGQ